MNNFWHDLPQPFFILAPMEAVTDVVFRHVVKKAGSPDIFFSEFTNATGWVHAGEKAIGGRLIRTSDEQPIVAQIWGGEPGDMEQLAAHCRELGYHGIDINMGCPAKSAIKSGGSALIRQPALAAEAIAAAKLSGLPVSVKTRLGYTHIDEWRDWLAHLLRQNIVNLTIHLRTKKEMSKVPAHFELIDDIVALRNEIAPHTLLTINGDIENRAHGLELIRKHPGVNGVMIGRGVFHDPFCFRQLKPADSMSNAELSSADVFLRSARPLVDDSLDRALPERQILQNTSPLDSSADDTTVEPLVVSFSETSTAPSDTDECSIDDGREAVSEKDGNEKVNSIEQHSTEKKKALINLLHYHLDIFDEYESQLHRPFETLKRFFKIYIRDFDGAAEVRDRLMHTKNTDEVREVLKNTCAI